MYGKTRAFLFITFVCCTHANACILHAHVRVKVCTRINSQKAEHSKHDSSGVYRMECD